MSKFDQLVELAKADVAQGRGTVNCTYVLAAQGRAYPRTCERCRLGPCPFYRIPEPVVEQIAAPEAQPIQCRHEPYQGRCAHCDVPFKNGRPDWGDQP